jgi:hypothetical protein
MTHVFGDIPNLANGVSQQAPALRLPSQLEESVNFNPTLLDGLTPRPPTEHLAKLYGPGFPDDAFVHTILRDNNEKYILVITKTDITVWDFAGNQKTVSNLSSTYISTLANPSSQLAALTVADNTFVLNKGFVAGAAPTTSPARPYEALINVMAGNYGKTYKIMVNGVEAANHQTLSGGSASDSFSTDTINIAANLLADMVASGLNTYPWACGMYGHTLYVRNELYDFTISCDDGYGGKAMKALKGKVQKFADLPSMAPAGVVFEVVGAEETGFDNYWVKFEASSGSFEGVWKESPAPNTQLGLNAYTMPHTLVRNNDGTFTFKPITWEGRTCGNLEKVPHPSFVGQKINDIFFHRNRFGILTEENVVLSEAGNFFNFYRTTLTALLDTDPIDVAASHVKVSIMRHAVPYQDVLMLFTDQTQFKLAGNELLTPKTVSARPVSEIPSVKAIRPSVSATSIFFMSEKTEWSQLMEYFLDKRLETADYDNVSSHAPAYIPAGVFRLVCAPELDVVAALTWGEPTSIYFYKYYYNGQEKLQSAWFKWTFPDCNNIVDVAWDAGKLLILSQRGDILYLEQVDFEKRPMGEGGYTVRLDRLKRVATGTYDAGTNKTRFTLPYNRITTPVVVTDAGPLPKGVALPVTGGTGVYVDVDGNHASQPVFIGVPFESRFTFSPFYYRGPDNKYRGPDNKKSVTDGRLQILHCTLNYSNSAYFKVEVTPAGRSTRTYPFNGRLISDPDNRTGMFPAPDGKISFPVLSRNDRVKIDVVSDSWLPCAFTSAVWHGIWNKASREM